MIDWDAVLARIVTDPRHLAGLDWGVPRPGHPEGPIRAHIADLERRLEAMRPELSASEFGRLNVLVHVHDAFKASARETVAIAHPESHASLAAAFLREHVDDQDLAAMVQLHDEPHALWRQWRRRGACDPIRLETLFARIVDWDVFTAFLLLDGGAAGKDPAALAWWFEQSRSRVRTRFAPTDIR